MSIIARVCFSKRSVTIAGDLAADRNSRVSTKQEPTALRITSIQIKMQQSESRE